MVIQKQITLKTRGHTDIIDITPQLRKLLAESDAADGHIIVFVPGSTGGITTVEYEPGLLKDLPEFFEKIIPTDRSYHHDKTWHDGNGYAHLRASLLGPSLTVPFQNGQLVLGTWQQVIFIDFDNRSRNRNLHVQIYS